MRTIMRRLLRLWYFNGNFEYRRQLKASVKHLSKIKKAWDHMSNKQRLAAIDADPSLKAGFAHYKAFHKLLTGKDIA